MNQQNPTLKKAMIEALEKSLGIVTTACKQVGINRATHYDWIEKDADYKEEVESICEMALDFAESQLQKRMKEGSDAAIIFYLKTKGKKRGYIERSEIDQTVRQEPIQLIFPDAAPVEANDNRG